MEAFPFLDAEKCIISIVGAGGKSTLLLLLAEYFAGRGKKVLVSTTTHIWKPEKNYAKTYEELHTFWKLGTYGIVGTLSEETQKLSPLKERQFLEMVEEAEIVLLEADGAKMMSLKVPAAHEPVIFEKTTIVIEVMGMSALGKPINEACFRVNEVCELLKKDGEDLLTIEDYVQIACSKQGGKKGVGTRAYYVYLTQCEEQETYEQACLLQKQIEEKGIQVLIKRN